MKVGGVVTMGGSPVSQPVRDRGFTLIEVLVTITLMGIVMAFSVARYSAWSAASSQSGTARELQSLMRQTQQRAVTEGRSMCVLFDVGLNKYTLFRGACSDSAKVQIAGPFKPNGSLARVSAPAFSEVPTTGVTFYARGTATQGSVQITRANSAKVYTIAVEGLTGRVSLT